MDEVCRPLLPSARRLLPYLESIDRRRWYSNWGELSRTLELRLSDVFGLPAHGCAVAGNATDALTAALLAIAGRATSAKPYCLIPSYTFVATAIAARSAGYTPYFIDIDETSFAMMPESLVEHPQLRSVGAVIAVAPYGRAIDVPSWRAFSHAAGVPVIVDAAAGFDAFASGAASVVADVPVVLSFHATKVFGTGEGGAILCADGDLAQSCHRALNFGFWGTREARLDGVNGKMSEYHAAVGLAELDGWDGKRVAFLNAAQRYAEGAERVGLGDRVLVQTDWASSYVLYHARSLKDAERAAAHLSAARLGFRWWYGRGVRREPAYTHLPSDPLPVTDDVAPRLIGLPVWVDIDEPTVNAVLAAVSGEDS